ncbi:MAG: hypothetical protein LBS01_05030 [Prevotellaceae bacterium]|jgi:hypothetical protein|nr:hypothetical protein [Prevotellaceae bacterium]
MNLKSKKSVKTLYSAGFVFLRAEDSTNTKSATGVKYIIKYSESFGTWKKYGEYATKAERQREIDKLMEDPVFLF